jgi:hypothetical protein
LCPDDFSNSKTSPGITVRKAPAHKNLISAALATPTPVATSNKHEIAATAAAANDVLNIAALLFEHNVPRGCSESGRDGAFKIYTGLPG